MPVEGSKLFYVLRRIDWYDGPNMRGTDVGLNLVIRFSQSFLKNSIEFCMYGA